jgi:uncharacterized membrane protein YebE (DUF533 family)
MLSVGGGVTGLTEMLQNAGRTAAPVAAGGLGGYVLANLLAKKRPNRESESDRERRENRQHLINLLGAAGGGALGMILKNKFAPGIAADSAGGSTKTSRDVKSFETIARLGRASAY